MGFQTEGAIAILTGASSGIGWELARLLVQGGASVIAVARRRERLQALRDAVMTQTSGTADRPSRGVLTAVEGDITEPEVRQRVIDVAHEIGGGRLDLLINNAGIGAIGSFESATEQRMRRVMEVNFFAPVELTRLAIPLLKQGQAPVICNVSSVLGHRAVPDKSEYCASKFALHGWSDALRAELYPNGIQVTLVSPSTTRSEFFDAVIDSAPREKRWGLGSWPPDRVARATLRAIRRRRAEVILSCGGKLLVYADRVAPPLVNLAVASRRPEHR